MITSRQIKDSVKKLGADMCGIAPVERFNDAPEGFSPTDIYPKCKSVIVFSKRVPAEVIFAASCVPYTQVSNIQMQELDRLGIELCLRLGEQGIGAVPIPSDDPYEYWESERLYGRAILSLRHAGYLAGLGVLGKNTLLINKKFGNMIHLGAVMVDIVLEEDEIASYEGCPQQCRLCIDVCPQKALNGATVIQRLCRPLSTFKTEKGYTLLKCSACRKACPNCLGIKE